MQETKDLEVKVRDDLYELKQHGNLDYPLALYEITSAEIQLDLIHWHWHEELEYIWVTKGKARFFAGDTCHILSEGQGILFNKNILHRVKAYEDYECSFYSLLFHPSLIFGIRNSYISAKYLFPVANHPYIRYVVTDEKDEKLVPFINLLKKVIDVNQRQEFGYELMTQSLLSQVWIRLAKGIHLSSYSTHNPENEQTMLDEERIKLALTYIAQHYAEPITLQDIASTIHISKSECCRCFQRNLQTSPFEYVIKYRVYSAAMLISHNENKLTISEIAAKTGFNSSSYFNKMFKKYLKCTPSDFKKQAMQNIEEISKLIHGYPEES